MPPPRRPLDADTKREEDRRLLTVLVTGFDAFHDRYPVNPSFEIVRSLPQLLPQSAVGCETIRIVCHDSPIRVCYEDVRAVIPPLLESHHGTIDLVLHVGMASGRQHYTAEHYAHRDNYGTHKDIDGGVPPSEDGYNLYGDCPVMMESSLDYGELMRKWRLTISQAPVGSPAYGADCRESEDAGHFICDYTYFNSLVWYARRNMRREGGASSDRPVMFLHVPAESDPKTLEKGRGVAMALIRAMVDTYIGAE